MTGQPENSGEEEEGSEMRGGGGGRKGEGEEEEGEVKNVARSAKSTRKPTARPERYVASGGMKVMSALRCSTVSCAPRAKNGGGVKS